MTFKPQLANSINVNRLPKFASDDEWWFEQKLDGIRMAIDITDGKIQGWGRDGQQTNVHQEVRDVLRGLTHGRWIFDGEYINNVLWVFDLLHWEDPADKAELDPYSFRREGLEAVVPILSQRTDRIQLLPCHRTTEEKVAMSVRALRSNIEGIMVKNRQGVYLQGKRSTMVLKGKFVDTVDCVVTVVGREGKRSIAIELYDEDGKSVDVGSCTVQPEMLLQLQVGDVVELKYLYATADRKLYQPAFLKIRDDKPAEQCTIDQLKFTDKTVLV